MLSFYSCRPLSFIFLILSVRGKLKPVSACPFLHVDRLGRGVQRGATPLAYWGIFSGHGVKREENPLISYGIFCPAKISVPCLHLPFPFVLAPEPPLVGFSIGAADWTCLSEGILGLHPNV